VVEAALIERLDVGYRTFVTGERGAALDGWRSRAALLDQPVTVDIAGQRRDGIMRGIDDSGALLLARADGVVERIVAGDLVRGPIAGATA
jgi:biotin-(acetyl-CoA carboxylase) ligase